MGIAVVSILLCCKSYWGVRTFFFVFWHLKRNSFFNGLRKATAEEVTRRKSQNMFFLARYSIWAKTHRCFSHLVSKSNKHIRVLEILVILSWKHICVFIVLFSIIRNTCVLFYLLGVHEKKTQKTQKTHTKNTLIVLEMGSNNTYVFLMVGSLKMKNTYVLWDSWSKILKTQTCFL